MALEQLTQNIYERIPLFQDSCEGIEKALWAEDISQTEIKPDPVVHKISQEEIDRLSDSEYRNKLLNSSFELLETRIKNLDQYLQSKIRVQDEKFTVAKFLVSQDNALSNLEGLFKIIDEIFSLQHEAFEHQLARKFTQAYDALIQTIKEKILEPIRVFMNDDRVFKDDLFMVLAEAAAADEPEKKDLPGGIDRFKADIDDEEEHVTQLAEVFSYDKL